MPDINMRKMLGNEKMLPNLLNSTSCIHAVVASRDGKLELPKLNSQAGARKLVNNIYTETDMTELLSERITMDANICHGKPTIRGLRYPVENILEWLSSGMSVDEILADYEDLEREDILAALEFASRLAKVKRIEMLAA
jgi:uncharacterized protein (DUF433 family)